MGDGSKENNEHKGTRHCPSAVGTAQEIGDFPPARNIQELFEPFPQAQLLIDWKNSISKGFGNKEWKYQPGRVCAEQQLG